MTSLPAAGIVESTTDDASQDPGSLASAFEALANPVRLALLHRLARPAFVPDLTREFGITRQAMKKHLDTLMAAGLVTTRSSRRGALPATMYGVDPTALFAFKEQVRAISVATDPGLLVPTETRRTSTDRPPESRNGPGVLLVHGDAPGRWFPLTGKSSWILGRDAKADVPLPYDPFASTRHALVHESPRGWTLTDLHATNGTRVNFRLVPAGEAVPVREGDLITVGKTQLLLRSGI